MHIDTIEPFEILNDPPELTQKLALERWKELNLLFHSIVLLGDELKGGRPLLPVLRAAATLTTSDRALLFHWDDARGRLRLSTALGFAAELPEYPQQTERHAATCLVHRKPVLANRAARVAGSGLSVPLTHQGMPWGVVQVQRDRPFRRDEGVMLWLFALVIEGLLPSWIGSKRHREMAAPVDQTSGLLAPDHFRRHLAWELQRSAWLEQPTTVACIQITEMLNGGPRGNAMTFTPREASQVLQKSVRQTDSATCLGGHHYIVAMPDTGRVEAEPVADLVREGFLLKAAGTLPVLDVMTGFATFPEDGRSESDLIRAACAHGRRPRRISRNPPAG